MNKINIKYNNRIKLVILNSFLFFLTLSTLIIPLLFVNFLPTTGVGHFFYNNLSYSLITIPVFSYFIIVGTFIYKIKINPYIVQITSYRMMIGFLRPKDYIDIAHTMLKDYSFFNRPFSFNKTLMIKIETDSGKIIAKRFNLTLITEKEVKAISKVLDRIIVKNN
jgi:hypothetical protein